MAVEDGRVVVDLHYGFKEEDAHEALAILISGHYMFKALQGQRARFRTNYPEVFATSEQDMIKDGMSEQDAINNTLEALDQYFDLLGKMIYMLGYELAASMGAPFPQDDDLDQYRKVSELDEEEVMSELARIMNTNN